MAGDTADAVVTVMDAAGNALLPRLTRRGVPIHVPLDNGMFRLGVDLRPRLGDNKAPWEKFMAPLLESPVLDDLTLLYAPAGGPRMTLWKEGE
jgi:hypothetical protein